MTFVPPLSPTNDLAGIIRPTSQVNLMPGFDDGTDVPALVRNRFRALGELLVR